MYLNKKGWYENILNVVIYVTQLLLSFRYDVMRLTLTFPIPENLQ